MTSERAKLKSLFEKAASCRECREGELPLLSCVEDMLVNDHQFKHLFTGTTKFKYLKPITKEESKVKALMFDEDYYEKLYDKLEEERKQMEKLKAQEYYEKLYNNVEEERKQMKKLKGRDIKPDELENWT